MPQPLPGEAFGQISLILRTSSGADGRAAIGHGLDRRQVVLGPRLGCSMICQAMVGTPPIWVRLLVLDQLHGLARDPTCGSWPAWRRRTARGSARRSSPWRGRTAPRSATPFCGSLGSGWGGASPRRRKLRAPRCGGGEDVAVDVAMGADRALGLPGRARGVEDRRVVLRAPAERSGIGQVRQASDQLVRPRRSPTPARLGLGRHGRSRPRGAADIEASRGPGSLFEECSLHPVVGARSSTKATLVAGVGQAVLQLRRPSTRRSGA